MTSDQKFVFSDGVILRCQFIKSEYIPTQMLDLQDVIRNIKEMLIEKMALRERIQEDERRKSASSISHLKHRFFLNNRTNSMPEGRTNSMPEGFSERSNTSESRKNSVILRMSPMMRRNKQYSTQRYSTGQILGEWLQENAFEDIVDFPEGIEKEYDNNNNNNNDNNNKSNHNNNNKKKTKEIVPGLNDNPQDYVHIATFTQFIEAGNFLTRLLSSRKTIAVEVDVSDTSVMSISYQQLDNFNQEFMMLNLKSSEHMLFLRPF